MATDARPIPLRPISEPVDRLLWVDHIKKLLDPGVIEPSNSPCLGLPDGGGEESSAGEITGHRRVVDYREQLLNYIPLVDYCDTHDTERVIVPSTTTVDFSLYARFVLD